MVDNANPPKKANSSNLKFGNIWAEEATDAVVNTVDKVRSVTTGPIVSASRILAYIIFAVFSLLIVFTLSIIAAVRGLEIATGKTWAAHGILGMAFVSLGMFAWSKRPKHSS
ncbi:MAG: hypothetical protein F4138_07665 [Acidimicrobiia bacterium]|nr:hypothetical protein [Acidimicrobiia bacterium]MYC57549.1 hypothetical protein [Acidimicrobiia bacterium]MYG94840.1 hypothetical protein [Acidimicrobiia bacterium]MYI30087.1 hypothetical protein [Acidimicrobiia bacterium]